MKRFLMLLFAGFAMSCTAIVPESTEAVQTKAASAIDTYLTEGVDNGFSGAVLIAHNGQVILNKGYGLADRGRGIENTPSTVFDIGSVTKQFTATAILKLAEMEKLTVSDPLAEFFKDIPDDKANITVHQLLTHTSGLISDVTEGDFVPISREDYFDKVFSSKLGFTPGERHQYSNAGYSILARVIELTSGKDYESFLNENLFTPAGMNNTGYLLPRWKKASLAKGYRMDFEEMGTAIAQYRRLGGAPWTLKGNGGINSTNEDMYKWYQALSGHTVISKKSTESLTTPYTPERANGKSFYGYGWAIYTSRRNTKIISHNGGNGIFFHDVLWVPEEDAIIIFATNTASRQVEVAWTLEKMLFDDLYKPKPIQKNFIGYVFDFIDTHDLASSGELIAGLKNQYAAELKNPSPVNSVGYMILREKKDPAWATALFEFNVETFPNDGNLWDSLGDGYLATKQTDKAAASFERAVDLGFQESAKKLHSLQGSE